jgi:hypothetical protein
VIEDLHAHQTAGLDESPGDTLVIPGGLRVP